MLETSARLLRLLSLLQARRDWTGPELASRLAVTTRTVRNDVERLRTLGYPVEAVAGVGGGYRLGIGAALPPLLLDDDEAVAVAIGLRTAAGGSVSGIEDSSVQALSKLERILPSRLRHRVSLLAKTMVTLPGNGPVIDADTLTVIATACQDHERLRFGYLTHGGQSGVRVVEPHRLVNAGRRWYLLAWDPEKDGWRTFRVDRMDIHRPTGPRFAPRPLSDEEVTERLAFAFATVTWRYRARVTVFAPAEYVAQRLKNVPIEPLDEHSCVIEAGSDSPQMLALHLGMLEAGFTFDEAEAPELANYFRELSERYVRPPGSGQPVPGQPG